jgi:hypothetical protein
MGGDSIGSSRFNRTCSLIGAPERGTLRITGGGAASNADFKTDAKKELAFVGSRVQQASRVAR